LSTQDERIRTRVDNLLKVLVKLVEETLNELVDAGELAEIDTASSAQAIVAFLEGVILFAKLRNDPELILSLAKTAKSIAVPLDEQPENFDGMT
ncbi:MAG: TetR family transcriptional regulator C-terminal domain-containing protein, partial [Methylococcales bacterium]